jgi:hypothetical protein
MATFGDIFKDKLDVVLDLAITDKYQEYQAERSEGPTERANPQTVTQPVYMSSLPGGQPVTTTASSFSPALLIGAGFAALVILVLLVRR